VLAVLEHQALRRYRAQPLGCEQKDVGLGLTVCDLVATRKRREVRVQRGALQALLELCTFGRRCHRAPEPQCLAALKQSDDAGHDVEAPLVLLGQ
jgi:hypothetical protein